MPNLLNLLKTYLLYLHKRAYKINRKKERQRERERKKERERQTEKARENK